MNRKITLFAVADRGAGRGASVDDSAPLAEPSIDRQVDEREDAGAARLARASEPNPQKASRKNVRRASRTRVRLSNDC
jgi:hypothetical protein